MLQLAIICDASSRDQWSPNESEDIQIRWFEDEKLSGTFDGVIDLLFQNSPQRIAALKKSSDVVIINSVIETLSQTDSGFVRINAWPGFGGQLVEASATNEQSKKKTVAILSSLGKTIEWLPDEPGFIAARVVCMIINEAFLALEEGVSSREEIDIAMKSGTNYPYGPFEWANRIGISSVHDLLKKLSMDDSRYSPARSLSAQV